MNIVIVNGVNITEENERLKTELEELKRDVKRFMEIANDCVVIDNALRELAAVKKALGNELKHILNHYEKVNHESK